MSIENTQNNNINIPKGEKRKSNSRKTTENIIGCQMKMKNSKSLETNIQSTPVRFMGNSNAISTPDLMKTVTKIKTPSKMDLPQIPEHSISIESNLTKTSGQITDSQKLPSSQVTPDRLIQG